MQQKSLFTHLVETGMVKPHENVANRGIEHLLNEYAEAREALRATLGMDVVPEIYRAEKVLESGNRPDVAGMNANGDMPVMIEGKFWAPLANGQAEGYLEYLSENGKLLLLCPSTKTKKFELELQKFGNKKVIVRSWLNLLMSMEESAREMSNSDMVKDVLNLKMFCEHVEGENIPKENQVPEEYEEQFHFYRCLIESCKYVLCTAPDSLRNHNRSATRITPSTDGVGYYFYIGKEIECFLHFSIDKLESHGVPLWLKIVWDRESKKELISPGTQKLAQALKEFEPENTYDNEIKINTTETDNDKLVAEIITRTNKILTHIKEKFPND